MTTRSTGIVLSAGVSFRVFPSVAIGVYADGMLSSAKKEMPFTSLSGESSTYTFSRKMNRIGISAGLNFNF